MELETGTTTTYLAEAPLSKENILWKAVLIQLLRDAFKTSIGSMERKDRYSRQARTFIESQKPEDLLDFEALCYNAGYEPSTVRAHYERLKQNPLDDVRKLFLLTEKKK